ncbi:hypothetical protein SAMN02799626_01488 [Caulobacter sp. UNC279MFTsu5.1]|nr:hypothetical protein SAMN02799626_01488 [Caulobacter sp. UNC279MFTsu5.1]
MEAVLAAYACRIKAYVAKTQPADAAAKSAAVDKALSDLSFELGMIQSAASDGAAALGVVKDGYMDKDERRPGAPVLDAAVTMAALADVDPNKLFISQSNLTLWAGLNIGSAVGVEGCGGVVHAAISDGGSSLQVSLSKAKSILINYLDPNTPPNVALGALFLSGAALPIKKSTGDTVSFKDCTKNVAAKVTTTATAVASSAPNTPPVADPVKTAEQAKNN